MKKVIVFISITLIIVGIVAGAVMLLEDRQEPRDAFSGWTVLGWLVVLALGCLIMAGLLYVLCRMVLSIKAAWYGHRHQRRIDALHLQRRADQQENDKTRKTLEATRVPADPQGRLGVLVRQIENGWQVLNLDAESGSVVLGNTGEIRRELMDPFAVAQLQAKYKLESERAKADTHPNLTHLTRHHEVTGASLPEPEPPARNWPPKVWLRDMISETPSLERLALGTTVDESGERSVTASLSGMVHVAVGGISGSGKSVFLRAIALQLATAAESCRLALIDLEGTTFAPFANSSRLRWPIATDEPEALAIMAALVDEMNRRKELYSQFPGVDSLPAYNAKAAEPLDPVICLIDEATALLSDRSVHNAARTLALRARKFGIWLFFGGQDWKAKVIDTGISNQLATRVQLWASSAAQSRVLLGDGCASMIETPGRAFVRLPGKPLTEIQTPMVTPGDVERALANQIGPTDTPEPLPAGHNLSGLADAPLIRRLHEEGKSGNEIQVEVFGYTGGAAYQTVRQVLSTTTTPDPPGTVQDGVE